MRFSTTLVAIAATAGFAVAQDASDADAALVRAQLVSVVSATTELDNAVLAFAGPQDAAALQAASEAVIGALNSGTAAVQAIQGFITVTQAATQLLDQVDALNTIVEKAIQDVINQKPALVAACLGPTTLEQLQLQLSAATDFRAAITLKFAPENRDLANSVSQPALDSLTRGISNFADQTALPPTCLASSSAAAPSSTAPPVSSSVPAVSTSSVPESSSAAVPSSASQSSAAASSSPTSSAAASTSQAGTTSSASSGVLPTHPATGTGARVTKTTTVCHKDVCTHVATVVCHNDVCTHKPTPTKSVTVCHDCKAATTTSPAKYTGGAVAVAYAGSNILAAIGIAAAVVL